MSRAWCGVEVGQDAPAIRYRCVVASGGGSFVAARRCAFSFPKRAHDLGPNIGPKLLSTGCHGEIEDALPKLEKSPKMLTE
jgi:hypothetical protein